MHPELPKLEQAGYRAEAFEEKLPQAVLDAIAVFMPRRLEQTDQLARRTGDGEAKKEFNDLLLVPYKKSARAIADRARWGKWFEAVALFDIAIALREGDLVRASERISSLGDGEEGEEERRALEEGQTRIKGERDRFSHYRDWLIENSAELRELPDRAEFHEWLMAMMARFEVTQKEFEKRGDKESHGRLKSAYDALDSASARRVLSAGEREQILEVLDREILRYRARASDFVAQGVILGKVYNEEELLQIEKKVIELRNFKINIEAGEW